MRSPGHRDHPEHHVDERPVRGRLRALIGADVLADSDDVIEVDEDGNPPRFYFPRECVRLDRMTPSPTRTYCPFKGEASYFSVEVGGVLHDCVVWYYPTPIPACEAIAGMMSFYPDRTQLFVDGTALN
jgi:uncharacterized protein (DUF427 family)